MFASKHTIWKVPLSCGGVLETAKAMKRLVCIRMQRQQLRHQARFCFQFAAELRAHVSALKGNTTAAATVNSESACESQPSPLNTVPRTPLSGATMRQNENENVSLEQKEVGQISLGPELDQQLQLLHELVLGVAHRSAAGRQSRSGASTPLGGDDTDDSMVSMSGRNAGLSTPMSASVSLSDPNVVAAPTCEQTVGATDEVSLTTRLCSLAAPQMFTLPEQFRTPAFALQAPHVKLRDYTTYIDPDLMAKHSYLLVTIAFSL